MAKAIFMHISTIVYIIDPILAKYFAFFNFDIRVLDESNIRFYIKTFVVFAFIIPYQFNSFLI